MKPKLFAEAARQRLQCRPAGVESPAVLQAKVDFFEAVVSRNAVAAKRAFAVMNCGRTPAPLTPAAQAKLSQRTNVLVQWIWALRERREEEARGIVHPPPTSEQMVEAGVVVDRFKRRLAGDDNAGRFE